MTASGERCVFMYNRYDPETLRVIGTFRCRKLCRNHGVHRLVQDHKFIPPASKGVEG